MSEKSNTETNSTERGLNPDESTGESTGESGRPSPPIVRMGDPVLRRVAAPVADPASPDVAELIADMEAALAEAGGIGLAAPQIGVSRRVILFMVPGSRVEDEPDDDDGPCPLTALINPVIEPIGREKVMGWEGCLSIPGMRGEVPRHRRIRLTGKTRDGADFAAELAGMRARVVQHEVDHLDGVLYFDRMADLSRLGFTEEILEAEAEKRRLARERDED